jgi:hypothetical protein
VISIACVQQLGDSHEGNFETLVAGDLPTSAAEEFAIHGLGRDLQAALDVQGRARGRGLLAEWQWCVGFGLAVIGLIWKH